MKKKVEKPTDKKSELNEDEKFPGYPAYPANEDITYRGEQEDLDVEKVTRSSRINNELARESSDNVAGQDEGEDGLDVPGADLDDENERIGEEDEENNYYSLGGDRHEDLEEDNEDMEQDYEDR
ncbi:hypothetical protein [Chitinophaga filiformis]|uniref:Uncharacterized protein n=1 Tax=Chitinophaga filiformis TaxID=104663 RepID=A0ABY4I6L2_CHIFI|nr:hypothetical protein [Chitinophaga filiformis]UPK70406.1 hypothetical protein MYF79_03745 [Chitinophaga filiformis]